jgi:hypothetical protein
MSAAESELRPPIFVGGTGRSGTTVFARLLGSHPDIFSLRWESQFIVARHGLIELVDSDFGEAEMAKFLELLRGRWFMRTLNRGKPNEYSAGLGDDISVESLRHAISALESGVGEGRPPLETAAVFVNRMFGPPTVEAEAVRWCEKTPRNLLYMARLSEMMPEAMFINVVRDGRDVACSMVERGFWPIGATNDFPSTNDLRGEVTFEKAIRYWVEMIRLGREVAGDLPEGHYLEVRLEDLVFDQRAAVHRVAEFLGEAPDRSLEDFAMRGQALGRWKRDLSTEEIAYARGFCGEVLAEFDYEP